MHRIRFIPTHKENSVFRPIRATVASAIAILLLLSAPAMATVDFETSRPLTLSAPPLDVAMSADGQWTYVLMAGGRVEIFNEHGNLDDVINVDSSMDKLSLNATGERLIVASSTTKKMEAVGVSFIQDIDTNGAPFLGPPNAPVSMVIFSDFQ